MPQLMILNPCDLPGKRNPDKDYHQKMVEEARKQISLFRKAKDQRSIDFYRGVLWAEESSAENSPEPKRNPSLFDSVDNPRLFKEQRRKHKLFHGVRPDQAFEVRVPKGVPKKLWALGKHEVSTTTSDYQITGGLLVSGSGNTIYIIDADPLRSWKKGGKKKLAQIQYFPHKKSKRHGPVYFHDYRTPPTITKIKEGFYRISGAKQKITARGIIG